MSKVVAFYRGEAADHRGRFLRDIWTWNDDQLEDSHDFIQWLFPLPEPSAYNPDAPLLTPDDINTFRRDPGLQANLLKSSVCILHFFGLTLAEDGCVQPGPNFPTRQADIWSAPNHNWLRMTRVLRSLTLLGLEAVAHRFYRCLQRFYQERRFPVPVSTYRYWTEAIRGTAVESLSKESGSDKR